MDQTAHGADKRQQALQAKLTPPAETTTSLVLNGIGNGMMIGVTPFLLMEMYARIGGKDIPRSLVIGNLFATVAGCAIGAYYGYDEARKVQGYRATVGNELLSLNQRIDGLTKPDSWAEKSALYPQGEKGRG